MTSKAAKNIFQHNSSFHFKYTKVDAPWYGPVKKAFEAFQKAGQYPAFSEEQFLDYLAKNYLDIYQNLEWVTFQEFTIRKSEWRGLQLPEDGFEFRLARANIMPDTKIRRKFFDEREKITAETGWYPLVMGSRTKASPSYIQRLKGIDARRNTANYGFLIGDLVGVRSATKDTTKINPDGTSTLLQGNSIILEGTKGGILFDTGFAVDLENIDRVRAIFLSHFHADHCGGFWEALESLKTFTILSDATLAYLLFKNSNISESQMNRLLENAYIVDYSGYKLKTDGYWDSFRVFHAPGSYGFVYRDEASKAVFYPGDLCLRNGFLDISEELFSYIDDFDAQQKTVLIDAAMIRRKDQSIEIEDTPAEVLNELRDGIRRRDVFFVTSSEEASVYTFLLAFRETSLAGELIQMVVNDQFMNLTQRLIQPVLRREEDALDPFVKKMIGKSIVNFSESQRVYPMAALKDFKPDDHLVIFATKDDLRNNPLLTARMKKSDVIIAGTAALRDDNDFQLLAQKCHKLLRVASPDWSFHSNENDLAEFIRKLSAKGIRSILFHSSSDNLKRWIRDNHLDPALVSPLHRTITIL